MQLFDLLKGRSIFQCLSTLTTNSEHIIIHYNNLSINQKIIMSIEKRKEKKLNFNYSNDTVKARVNDMKLLTSSKTSI